MALEDTPDAQSTFPAKPQARRSLLNRLARCASKGRVTVTSVCAVGGLHLSSPFAEQKSVSPIEPLPGQQVDSQHVRSVSGTRPLLAQRAKRVAFSLVP